MQAIILGKWPNYNFYLIIFQYVRIYFHQNGLQIKFDSIKGTLLIIITSKMKNLFKVTFAVAAIAFATSCSSSKTEEAAPATDTAVAVEATPAVDSTAVATTDSTAATTEAATTEAKAEEHK
jgi:hypothetical protein